MIRNYHLKSYHVSSYTSLITQICTASRPLIGKEIMRNSLVPAHSPCIQPSLMTWLSRCSSRIQSLKFINIIKTVYNIMLTYDSLVRNVCITTLFEFSYISFSAKSWQNSASNDIQWLRPIVCQHWQDSAMIRQKITKYRKTRM